jgi:hypothetical protein
MSSYYEIFNVIAKYAEGNAVVTNKTYTSRMVKLFGAGKELKNYDDVTTYLITKYTKKTYKSFLTAIVVYLKATDDIPSLIAKYSDEMKRMNDLIQDETQEHIKTESENANMVTKIDIEKIIDTLKDSLRNREEKRGDLVLFTDYQKYLVVNLYYLIPPVRNDFVDCLVYDSFITEQDTSKNYIFLVDKKLILNRYKTKKKYGKVEIDLPEELVDIIKSWLNLRSKLFPDLIHVKYLLLTRVMTPMGQVNLTQFLNKIFGRNVSTTMLRKSYITEKYPVIHTTNEMKKDAKAMQHSVTVQQTAYRKK